jgi:hypothetical protein
MRVSSVSVNGITSSAPHEVVKIATVTPESNPSREGELFKAIASTAGGTFVADKAWAGFHASQTLTLQQVQDGLIANGLAPAHAPTFANAAYEVIKSEPTRILLVAVAAGGGTIAVLEATKKFNVPWKLWSRKRVLLTGVAIAVVAGMIYFFLKKRGLMS